MILHYTPNNWNGLRLQAVISKIGLIIMEYIKFWWFKIKLLIH